MGDEDGGGVIRAHHTMSAADIDLDLVNRSLASVNNFSRRRQLEKLQPVLMYEIPCDGESFYRTMTLRELLGIVNSEAKSIDDRYWADRMDKEKGAPKGLNASSFFRDQPPESSRAPQSFLVDAFSPEVEIGQDFSAVSELRLRDLRRLDYQFNPNEEKSILIRKHAVLFAMDPIRAVVMASRLILLVPDGADTLISILDEYMREWINEEDKEGAERQYAMPFEAHAYEALITTVKAMELQEFSRVDRAVQETLAYFRMGSLIPVSIQEEMRGLKNDLSLLINRIISCRNALHTLTEDDEEMALMNLSLLRRKPHLYRFPLVPEILISHDETEELIESYLIDFNTLELKAGYIRSQIQSAEELVSLRLDTSRNELLIANTALAVLACSIGFGAYITGIFGMNLDNVVTVQPLKHSFVAIAVGSFGAIAVIFACIIIYLRQSGMLPVRLQAKSKGAGAGSLADGGSWMCGLRW